MIESLARRARRAVNQGVFDELLKPFYEHFGDAEGVANFWMDHFKTKCRQLDENPHDEEASKFVADTLFSMVAFEQGKTRLAFNVQRSNKRLRRKSQSLFS